jgi:hypothetical protein
MPIKHIALSVLLLSALAWAGCKKDDDNGDDPQPTEQQIVVGAGLTDLKIGDAAQKWIDKYGITPPSFSSFGGQYTHFLIWFSAGVTAYCEPTAQSTFDASMKVKRIELSSPFKGKTDKGIGIGSKKADVKAAYGEPTSSSTFFGDEYAALGLTFVYSDTGDLVERIEVEKP